MASRYQKLAAAVKRNNDCRFNLHSLEQLQVTNATIFRPILYVAREVNHSGIRQQIQGHLQDYCWLLLEQRLQSCLEALGAVYASITCYGVFSSFSYVSYLS